MPIFGVIFFITGFVSLFSKIDETQAVPKLAYVMMIFMGVLLMIAPFAHLL